MARNTIRSQIEATDAQIQAIDQRITKRLDRITETLERLGNRVDALAVQTKQFNSGMAELKGLAQQVLQAIDCQSDAANVQNQAINRHLQVAQQQAATITELAKLVATQASTLDFTVRHTNA